ncbi:GAF and HD-GYP domain-containing protein [Desulfotomaculum nigrificans]|uniref:GAF and HD-GYP domain-containing protein n=1 Tax=Desulfotomaculum nigrificans TaxID=1565 RepID=UPI003BEF42E4
MLVLNGKTKDAEFGGDEARFLSVLRASLDLAIDRGQEETGEIELKGSRESQIRAEQVQAKGTVMAEVMKTGQPLVIEDLEKYDGYLCLPDCGNDIRSAVVFPVKTGGKIIGALIVCTPFTLDRERNEVGYLSIIASQVGLAIENAQLYESLREYYMNVVNALAAALEAKDKYTQGHSLRVALWAKAVAEEMGLSDKEQEMVYIGGLLHDIGKVGVREYILLKTSKLTPEEEKEIQTHPRVGAKILEPANLPQEVVETVLYHHENYNGGGYPEGIAGEQIPLLARIIRVVDSYDAMKSDRPYRKALSQKWVIEELSRCSGKQFDPAVVEAVKKLIEQGKLA